MRDAEIVVADGRILEVRSAGGAPAEHHDNCVLMPAFTNAHCHLEYTLFRNVNELWPFVTWIQRVTPLKKSATLEELAASALIGAVENAAAGVGLIGEYSDMPVGAGAIAAAGIRGVVYQEFICLRPEPPHEEQLQDCLNRAETSRREGGEAISVHPTPHAPYSVVAPMLRRFGRGRLSIHCAESAAEEEFLLRGSGPFDEAYRRAGIPWVPPGMRPVPYLDRLGLLRPETQLVHAIQLSLADLARIAASGASVAHCPKSNLKLGTGAAPVREMLELGVTVGLGTDSLMSNNRVDLFEEMRTAGYLCAVRGMPPIPPRDLLRMATLDGAESLGEGAECGALEPGRRADFITVSLDRPHFHPLSDVETALVYCGTAADVRALYMGGELVRAPIAEFARAGNLCEEAIPRIREQASEWTPPTAVH